MNKQQLAAKIWESANQMRSKIEANEYKDYILGFIFYKYLSDKERQLAEKAGMTSEGLKSLSEEDSGSVDYFKKELGYFIAYKNLFSTWIEKGGDFNVSDVRDALSAFSRLISSNYKKLFDGIFETLETGLSKLGDSVASQTRAISELIHLIQDIPMGGKQDYDVLGFIYEYLIEKFAANAGKKAGEFYTPHEVSLLMSEIVAYHLKAKKKIQIYDPTSGSGSLLINIGSSVAKHVDDRDHIKYYAQELKKNTYNLTRMNLVMRGIMPNNIYTRNADTLEDDWPYFDENDPSNTYDPLYVDAVVSNPPYSQKWNSDLKDNDPRYSRFGLAPKTKADYAFLLHDLYHLKPDGIMAIVLPHGVLFRGGEEGKIRRNLIEQDHIDAVIGLPANIFFGTGIPTIVLVLRQKRKNNDVLIIDASKGFLKEGKSNKLRSSDIKRISDTFICREAVPKYAEVVSKEVIRQNDYNLNIPRYVDSSASAESWDVYASMFGGVPRKEMDELEAYWQAFPALRDALFSQTSSDYLCLKSDDVKNTIVNHADVKRFMAGYDAAFSDFDVFLKKQLLDKMEVMQISQKEAKLSEALFARLKGIDLIDKYEAYQLLSDSWQNIAVDLEIVQTEGFAAVKQVDPNMVLKKKQNNQVEEQEGWVGHIMPFELVQKAYLGDALQSLEQKENRFSEISSTYEEIIESFSEEEKDSVILDDSNTKFISKEVTKELEERYADAGPKEIHTLRGYLALFDNKAKNLEKEDYIKEYIEIPWEKIAAKQNSVPAKAAVKNYISELQSTIKFPEDSYEGKIAHVCALMAEEKTLKQEIKVSSASLHLDTKAKIESLSDSEAKSLLEQKWIHPLLNKLKQLPDGSINELASKVQKLADKYATTYADIASDIKATEQSLAIMLDELTGSESDQQALAELKALLSDNGAKQ